MASSVPDLSTLTSSADVFASTRTLPQIRTIHRSLHAQIDDKAARLRTQVGSSYRDLLGTADTIVQMRSDNDAVQTLLGNMGSRCGRGIVGSKISELGKFNANEATGDEGLAMGIVARARLLEGCVRVVWWMLKKGYTAGAAEAEKMGRGDVLLLASKVHVLSRLLGKSFTAEELADPEVRGSVDTARKNLVGLKKRLVRCIQKVLQRTGSGAGTETSNENIDEDVLKALCAYSLAENLGSRDVLRHFLHFRAQAMAMTFDGGEGQARQRGKEDVLKGMMLYTRTLLGVQAMVPTKLAHALHNLKKKPLLEDEFLHKIEGLRLDIYGKWCGDEIKFFTPFIRHDDLDGPFARATLTTWAANGGEVLVAGLKKTMERMMEFKTVMELRTSVLDLWIRDGGKARGFDPSEMLESLRTALNEHMRHVLVTKVNKLHLVATEVSATLESWQDGTTDKQKRLFEDVDVNAGLAMGPDKYLLQLMSQLYGRNDSVSKAVNCFNSWIHVVGEAKEVVEKLQNQRWDGDIDNLEDEETIEERQHQLSKEDPKALNETLDSSLEEAFKTLEETLAGLWKSRAKAEKNGAIAMYFIRVLRDVRSGLPKTDSKSIRDFGLAMVPSLHETLTSAVSSAPLEAFASQGLSHGEVAIRHLWEGDPELPTMPSFGLFYLMRDISASMQDAGIDLWSATSLAVLKKHLRTRVCELWTKAVDSIVDDMDKEAAAPKKELESEDTDGDERTSPEQKDKSKSDEKPEEEAKPEPDQGTKDGASSSNGKAKANTDKPSKETKLPKREVLIQWIFDITYLRCAIDNKAAEAKGKESKLADLQKRIIRHAGLDNDQQRQKIAKSAETYWASTSLLFGLLASG